MTSIEFSLSSDCRFIIVKTTGIQGDGLLTFFNNGVQQSEMPIEYVTNQTSCTPSVTTASYEIDSVIPGELGVIVVQATDYSSESDDDCQVGDDPGTSAAGMLGACELQCCLAKKVLELSKCDCDTPQCDQSLQEAQKLYLYISSMQVLLDQIGSDPGANAGIESQAIEIYNKAKNLCLTSCGCNC